MVITCQKCWLVWYWWPGNRVIAVISSLMSTWSTSKPIRVSMLAPPYPKGLFAAYLGRRWPQDVLWVEGKLAEAAWCFGQCSAEKKPSVQLYTTYTTYLYIVADLAYFLIKTNSLTAALLQFLADWGLYRKSPKKTAHFVWSHFDLLEIYILSRLSGLHICTEHNESSHPSQMFVSGWIL